MTELKRRCPICGVEIKLPDWPYDYCPSCVARTDIKICALDILSQPEREHFCGRWE